MEISVIAQNKLILLLEFIVIEIFFISFHFHSKLIVSLL